MIVRSLLVFVGCLACWAGSPKAARAWEPLRSANPDVEEGNAKLAEGNAKAALEAYGRAARALPDAPGVHLNRGLALLASGDLGAAREALRLAATADGERSLRAQAYYDLGLAFYREGDELASEDQHAEAQQRFREAADALKQSLRLAPGSEDAAWNLELALRRIREEQEKAEAQQDQAQDQRPKEKQDGDAQDGQSPPSPSDDDATQQEGETPQDGEHTPEQERGDDPEAADDEAGKDDASKQTDDAVSDGPSPERDPAERTPRENQREQPEQGTPKALPSDVARALDALQSGERSLQQVTAGQRARGRRQPEKDW